MTARRPGAPLWADLTTTDITKAKAFYSKLLGWEFNETGEDYGHYVLVAAGGTEILGMMGKTPEMAAVPDAWTVYLGTDDAQRTLDEAGKAGGKAIMGPMEIPGEGGPQGTMGVLGDPDGAVIGLWQPGKREGFVQRSDRGHVAWVELITKDFDGAMKFYGDVFKMELADMAGEGFRYATLGPVDDADLGIGDGATILPEQIPSHWRIYFSVSDVDAAVDQVKEMGGNIMDGPSDSPHGRLATVTDDQGALFLLAGPNKGS